MKNIVEYRKKEEKQDFTELENRLRAEQKKYHDIPVPEEMRERVEEAVQRAKKGHRIHMSAVIAAAIALLIILPNTDARIAYAMGNIPVVGKIFQTVTFRNYQYESEHFEANVEVPQIVVGGGEEEEEEAKKDSEKLQEAVEQVNFDIEEVTNQLINEFQASVELEEGYAALEIQHEIIMNNERYFTLRLSIYQAAASGAESYKFYTIDKQSGQQIRIGELFQEGSGYQELLSENIKEQMRAAMAEDEMMIYWIDSTDMPEMNWQGLKEEQNFYFDEDDNLVIVFDEYEVAPGYMGAQEFTIEKSVFEQLLK